jgi:hypothetical protein
VSARALVALPFLLALGGAAFACSSSKATPAAGLVIAIDTDMTPGRDFDHLQIEVQPPGGAHSLDNNLCGTNVQGACYSEFGQRGLPVSFPTTLAIVDHSSGSGEAGSGTVLVRASIGVGGSAATADGGVPTAVGAPLVNREALVTIPRDRIALLRIHLEWQCIGTAGSDSTQTGYVSGLCPEGTTCIGGACVDWNVDSSTLPNYDEAQVFGGGSAAGDGKCFDTSGCFSSGMITQVDTTTCTIPLPKSGGTPNVALVSGDGHGICSDGTCLVVLDQNDGDGFSIVGDQIQLPKTVCATPNDCPNCNARPRPTGVAVTTACQTKTPSLPTCGPWSAIQAPGTLDASAPSGVSGLDAGAPKDAAKD